MKPTHLGATVWLTGLWTRGTSLRRACRVIGLSAATWRYQRRTTAVNATVLARL